MTLRTYLLMTMAVLCLAACSKSGPKPNTPPGNTDSTTTTGTLNINCTLPFAGAQTELLVSEPGGKLLLDTVATSAGPITAALKTNDTIVDVTLVETSNYASNITVDTYKSINPSRLSSLVMGNYPISYPRAPSDATESAIYYYNLPAIQPAYLIPPNMNANIFFTNYPFNYYSSFSEMQYENTVRVDYDNYIGNYAYFLLPQLGLYSLHMQQNQTDSVDCSQLDTATLLTFNRPTPFTTISGSSTLFGIMDTSTFTKVIDFRDYQQLAMISGVDYEYAPIPVEKYEMNYFAGYPNGDVVNYYAYTPKLPQTLPLPQESNYTVSSAQQDDFSVTFSNFKPSYYQVTLSDSLVGYTIWMSPDSANIQPVPFLTNLKSKLLQNSSLNSLQLNRFAFADFNGYNYAAFFNYITIPNSQTIQNASAGRHVAYVSALQKGY
jgi:hypothetical protein